MPEYQQDTDEILGMLADSAERVFAEQCTKEVVNDAEAGNWPSCLWDILESTGFTYAAVPEAQGGSGLLIGDALPLARIAACHAAPVPFGETLIASWLLALSGLDVPAGPLVFAPAARRSQAVLKRSGNHWLLNGSMHNVPWGESATGIVLVADADDGPHVACIDPALAQCKSGRNLAGEPRMRMDFKDIELDARAVAAAPAGIDSDALYVYGALLRCQQMAGALQTVRDIAVRYTSERIAFGKPLNRLQAVQQNLAVLASQAAAARVAADMALAALGNPDTDLETVVGLAKVRVNEAAGIGARLGHQALGAMGFTDEHHLQLFTRRLWSWRDEFGNDSWWAEQTGQRIIEGGADALWKSITRITQL